MIHLSHSDLGEDFNVYFPGAIGGETFAIVLQTKTGVCTIGHVLMQDAEFDTVGIHLYVLPECRTTVFLRALVNNFKPALTKYMHSVQKTKVVSVCRVEDRTIKTLFRLMDFDTEDICVGKLTIRR